MADLDTVYVVTEVDETDIGKVQIGQPVTITVEAYPDMPFQGEVLKIAPQGRVIQNVTTFEVTSELKNVAATGSRQGMMRGAEGRRGGGEGRGGRWATRLRKYDRRTTRTFPRNAPTTPSRRGSG